VRCPWHHACFSLRTGEAVRAPPSIRCRAGASSARTTRSSCATSSRRRARSRRPPKPSAPLARLGRHRRRRAAGFAAAEILRREGYDRPVTVLSADDARPATARTVEGLSRGHGEGVWIPLKSPKFYEKRAIDLRLNARVAAIDPRNRRVTLADGKAHDYGALLLATGADPVRLDLPAADAAAVHYLRTLGDSGRLLPRRARPRPPW